MFFRLVLNLRPVFKRGWSYSISIGTHRYLEFLMSDWPLSTQPRLVFALPCYALGAFIAFIPKKLNALNKNTFSKPLWSTRFFFFSKFNAAVRYSAHYYLTMAAASPSGYGGYGVALFPLQQSAVPDHAKPSVFCLDCGCMEIPATSLVATLQAFSVWWLNIFIVATVVILTHGQTKEKY